MMEHRSLDPYEQQLLKVFDSYDYDNRGSLDRDGLMQLCQTLQLEEQSSDLIKRLLNKKKNMRVTFIEFKEALLTLLDNIQNINESTNETDGSPEREVSPKFVYGSKKYGRRSRPRTDEISSTMDKKEIEPVNKIVHGVTVQRSNSQSDVMHSKKRKTNTNLKRCTSFPGNHLFESYRTADTFIPGKDFTSSDEFICTENMLKEVWKKLGVGENGYLNKTELTLVCDAIGLHKLANGIFRQLSDKLITDFNHKISFQELLEALQQDDAWVDVLNTTLTNADPALNLSCLSNDSVSLNSRTSQYINLGPKGNGHIDMETVIEMWETAGVTSPRSLLSDLGFISTDIDIMELATVLEKEIKGINETGADFTCLHISLLQAVLSLYQLEIRCLKNVMEQMQTEREKLKCDITEANNRVTLLAQEVDDNHTKMERNIQNQVKVLEQRHAEILREITEQCSNEKDQLIILNQNLKQRISHLESEESKLRNDINLVQKYLSSIEKENQKFSEKIVELEKVRQVLKEEVQMLESEKQKYREIEELQIETLMTKLSTLQSENSRLRDRNDEMLSEIENLNAEILVLRMKVSNTSSFNLENSVEENIAVTCERACQGSKRRNDGSPSKNLTVLGLGDGSPRLGKVRKFQNYKDVRDIPFTSSESGIDTELDCGDLSLTNSWNDAEEIMRLQTKISSLEQLLRDHSIPIPFGISSQWQQCSAAMTRFKSSSKHVNIQNILIEVKTLINEMPVTNLNFEVLKNINDKLDRLFERDDIETKNYEKKQANDVSTETDMVNDDKERNIEQYIVFNKALCSECDELKNCLEQLESEYEKCEKYWALTLEEERKVFEQEQNQYSEHLAQLMQKISEFDEEFVRKDKRLPPIEEKVKLEDQFADLEHEFADYKVQVGLQIEEKNREVLHLEKQLKKLTAKTEQIVNVSVQTDYLDNISNVINKKKHNNLSNHVIESTNLFPSDTTVYTLTAQNTTECNSTCPNDNEVPHCLSPEIMWGKEAFNKGNSDPVFSVDNVNTLRQISLGESDITSSLPVNILFQSSEDEIKQSLSLCNLPSTSKEITCNGIQKNSTPLRPKRTRKYEQISINRKLYKKNNETAQRDSSQTYKWSAFNNWTHQTDTVTVPVITIHNLNAKLHHWEQRYRHIQWVLKQEHHHAEQILQHYWQQQKSEKSELQFLLKNTQERLERQNKFCSDQLDRLARTDMLVKDLYVENSFLVASVQRLEQKCHILTQCSSNSV